MRIQLIDSSSFTQIIPSSTISLFFKLEIYYEYPLSCPIDDIRKHLTGYFKSKKNRNQRQKLNNRFQGTYWCVCQSNFIISAMHKIWRLASLTKQMAGIRRQEKHKLPTERICAILIMIAEIDILIRIIICLVVFLSVVSKDSNRVWKQTLSPIMCGDEMLTHFNGQS